MSRDLRSQVDYFGNISVDVTIGGGPSRESLGSTPERMTGANHTPAGIAAFLRELADDFDCLAETLHAESAGGMTEFLREKVRNIENTEVNVGYLSDYDRGSLVSYENALVKLRELRGESGGS